MGQTDHLSSVEKNDHKNNPKETGCIKKHANYTNQKYPRCNYRKNAHDYSIANEPHIYNIPSFRSPERWVNVWKSELRPAYYVGTDTPREGTQATSPDNGAWHLSKGKNFTEDKTPYWHNTHHCISCGEILENFDSDEIRLLIATHWNINEKENVIILPKQFVVARMLKLPTHVPPQGQQQHKDYSSEIGKGLQKIKSKLSKNADDEDEHKHALVTSDSKVGNIFPFYGSGDRTVGWRAKPGVFEDFEVNFAVAPHHIIPGKASMEPSTLEKWTCADKGGKIKEDIGYNIDCAENGIFLPHLPEIYFTRYVSGTKIKMSKYYGQTWKGLSDTSKESIAYIAMGETQLQLHYTDHDDPYYYVDHDVNYDDECKEECNALADFMSLKSILAKCKDDDGKLNPPYNLVARINTKSRAVKGRITGYPKRWTSWISPLAQKYTNDLIVSDSPLSTFKGLIRRVTIKGSEYLILLNPSQFL